ncbi:unnamed protein product [Chrysodeixis includens]|uniref:Uncharacterized protein n=1 Tax=Chrysodeixis includens TaxID=689277 RepID=A0A9N8L4Q0_CHRIL|nr:unnamed protein product [Chrysodeixis includens]
MVLSPTYIVISSFKDHCLYLICQQIGKNVILIAKTTRFLNDIITTIAEKILMQIELLSNLTSFLLACIVAQLVSFHLRAYALTRWRDKIREFQDKY